MCIILLLYYINICNRPEYNVIIHTLRMHEADLRMHELHATAWIASMFRHHNNNYNNAIVHISVEVFSRFKNCFQIFFCFFVIFGFFCFVLFCFL